MRNSQTDSSLDTNRIRGLFAIISVYLIGSCLWRALTPAHEYDSLFGVFLTVLLDLLAMIGLFGLKTRLARDTGPRETPWTIGEVLFWVAFAASLGLIVMRFFNGEAGLWTGHLTYTLS